MADSDSSRRLGAPESGDSVAERADDERTSGDAHRKWFESVPEALFVADSSARFLEANQQGLNLLGYTLDELREKSVLEIGVMEEQPTAAEGFDQLMAGKPARVQCRVLKKDGTPITVSVSARMLDDGRLQAVVRDITNDAALEAQRDRERRRQRAVLDRLPLACIATDAEFRITYFNAAAERLLGWSQQEVVGRHPFGLITAPEMEDYVRHRFQRLTEGELVATELGPALTKWGTKLLLEWTDTPIKRSDGTFDGVISVCRDVAERERMIRALEQSERRYRSLVEHVPNAILATRGPLVSFCNPAAVALFHAADARELIGRSFLELIEPGSRDAARSALEATGAREEPLRVQVQTLDGTTVGAELNAVPLDGEEEERGSLVMLRDLTERDVLERRLQQKQKLEVVGQLAGGIAHDFNNLLTVILSACALIERKGVADTGIRTEIDFVRGAAESAAGLTRRLLAFARRQPLEPRVFDLGELVATTQKMLERILGEDIDLVVSRPRALWPVRADPRQMEQVLVNLAANARAAMPAGGRLSVAAKNELVEAERAQRDLDLPPGRYVELSVTDTGVGMDENTLQRIFEPFFTTRDGGSGLGLATCYGIVEQAGGTIGVESTPGRGSRFTVYLPAASEGAISLDPPSPRPTTDGATGAGTETILLVEDDPAVGQLASSVLVEAGYTVLHARSGAEALARAHTHAGRPIELLLTDVVMPGMSGAELAPRLAKERQGLAVLYMSGYAEELLARHGMLGEIAFLAKPFTPEVLLARVREVLDAHRAESIDAAG